MKVASERCSEKTRRHVKEEAENGAKKRGRDDKHPVDDTVQHRTDGKDWQTNQECNDSKHL
jgi:hypothetical protein